MATVDAFKDQHILVTGGSSGIGKCVAYEFLKRGASVTIVARREKQLAAAAAELRTVGEVHTVQCDCSDAESVMQMVHSEDERRPIDVLVNSAGKAIGGYFEELSSEVFESQMKGNYFSQLHPTHAVFARMKARRKGRIVLVSSMAGQIGVFGFSAYSPAKFALRGLAETLHYEGAPYGVGVSIAFPPDTDTPGFREEQVTVPEETKAISADGGLFHPEKVARVIVDGVARQDFRMCVGVDSKMLGIVTAGMSPGVSIVDVLLIPILRALSAFYVWSWTRIVERGVPARGTKST